MAAFAGKKPPDGSICRQKTRIPVFLPVLRIERKMRRRAGAVVLHVLLVSSIAANTVVHYGKKLANPSIRGHFFMAKIMSENVTASLTAL